MRSVDSRFDNKVTCELTCGCVYELPRDMVKTGQIVMCTKCKARYTIDRVVARRWHISCTLCKFARWAEERSGAVELAQKHHGRTVANHGRFMLSFRHVTRTGATRSVNGTPYNIEEQTPGLFDPPPF